MEASNDFDEAQFGNLQIDDEFLIPDKQGSAFRSDLDSPAGIIVLKKTGPDTAESPAKFGGYSFEGIDPDTDVVISARSEEEGGEELEVPEHVDYELSDNQRQFVKDAGEQDLDIDFTYSGRGMYGRECPSVVVESPGDFGTKADTECDNMGLSFVIYAQS